MTNETVGALHLHGDRQKEAETPQFRPRRHRRSTKRGKPANAKAPCLLLADPEALPRPGGVRCTGGKLPCRRSDGTDILTQSRPRPDTP